MYTLRTRVLAAFFAALVPGLLALGFLVWSQQAIQATLSIVTEGYLPLSRIGAQLERDRDRMHREVSYLISERDEMMRTAPTEVSTEALRETVTLAVRHIQQTGPLIPEQEQRVYGQILSALDTLRQLLDDYETVARELVAQQEAGQPANENATKVLERRQRGIQQETRRIIQLVDSSIARITRSAEEAQARTTSVAVPAALVFAVFSLLLMTAVILQLRPIGQLTEQVQRVTAGKPGERVEVTGSSEMALLAHEFNDMVRSLEARDHTLTERATEMKRLNRYLESVLNSLDDGLLVVEAGRVTLANPAASSRWGAHSARPAPAPLDELVGRPGRYEVTGPADTLHEVRVAAFGEQGCVIVTADITRANRDKERLALSERLALVGQMLAQITHEVRNPLNALSLNTELLADELENLDPRRQTEAWELHATVANEIERLTAVTGHYLQLARRPPAHLGPEHLPALFADIHRLMEAELDLRGIRFDIRPSPVSHAMVDGNQLRQALINIVRNAIEAGAKTLTLEVTTAPQALTIVIRDDGPGMSDEELARAFDPFYSTKASGTGLGLAITRQILEDHGGRIDVESNSSGTAISLVLPRHPEVEAQPSDGTTG